MASATAAGNTRHLSNRGNDRHPRTRTGQARYSGCTPSRVLTVAADDTVIEKADRYR